MSERYTRLFSTENNLYTPTSPVVICAGALLKDNETDRLIAQIKFKSIIPNEIASIVVSLTLFDSADRVIGEKVEYTYLDLQLKRDEETGHKEPVFIRETNARAFSIMVKEVIFCDKTIWSADGTEWKSLGDPKTLIAYLNDSELAEQYGIDCQNEALCVPKKVNDIWICSCGKINSLYETECHNCLLDYDTLIENLNTERLRDNFIKRKYSEGIELMKQGININSREYLNKAIVCFEKSNNFEDSVLKITECNNKIAEINAADEAEKIKRTKKIKKYSVIASIAAVFLITISVILNTFIIPEHKYKQAEEFALNRNYGKAIAIYREIYDYKDSKKKILDITSTIMSAGSFHTVGLKSNGSVIATGRNDDGECNVGGWRNIIAVWADKNITIGLKSDGTVVATGDNTYGQCNVDTWTDIIDVSINYHHTVGLRSDGTVVATGENGSGECDVDDWKDIIAISTDVSTTVGVKSDGTVVTAGYVGKECNVDTWTDIIDVAIGFKHIIGLKSDGTVVATGDNTYGQCDVDNWMDIIAVWTGDSITVGLTSNGTVVCAGYDRFGREDIGYRANIIDISLSDRLHVVGLKSDGKAIAVGTNDGECDVDDWIDIISISTGYSHTVGLKSDGTMVATGHNLYGQCNVYSWDLF